MTDRLTVVALLLSLAVYRILVDSMAVGALLTVTENQ
jgi:hypothetical protein